MLLVSFLQKHSFYLKLVGFSIFMVSVKNNKVHPVFTEWTWVIKINLDFFKTFLIERRKNLIRCLHFHHCHYRVRR